MEQCNTWTASSKFFEQQDKHDLTALVGRWNENLQVVFSLPTTITRGPIVQHFSQEETLSAQPSDG